MLLPLAFMVTVGSFARSVRVALRYVRIGFFPINTILGGLDTKSTLAVFYLIVKISAPCFGQNHFSAKIEYHSSVTTLGVYYFKNKVSTDFKTSHTGPT
jgi:hypothetical protein